MGGWLSRRLFPVGHVVGVDDLDSYGALLEGLEAELESLQRRRAAKAVTHRRLIRSLLLYGTAAMALLAAALYAAGDAVSATVRLLLLVAFPLGAWLLKQTIDRGYRRSIRHDDNLLDKLGQQKEKMVQRMAPLPLLEELMERTHFTRTAQLLHKFQRRSAQQQPQQGKPQATQGKPQPQPPKPGQLTLPSARTTAQPPSTPLTASVGPSSLSSSSSSSSSPAASVALHSAPFTPPRAVLPGVVPGQPYVTPADLARFQRTELQQPSLHRSSLDKLVDFVLGDGPNNRFALICSNCFTHNGLVRPEEFDTVKYRCTQCNFINSQHRLPNDWTPTIHNNTTTAIIQSAPSPRNPSGGHSLSSSSAKAGNAAILFDLQPATPSPAAPATEEKEQEQPRRASDAQRDEGGKGEEGEGGEAEEKPEAGVSGGSDADPAEADEPARAATKRRSTAERPGA